MGATSYLGREEITVENADLTVVDFAERRQPSRRLEFVDALRGVASVAVLVQHCAEKLWPSYFKFSLETFRPGQWGVFVFFMLSGLVIPLSLKNETSVVSFWIGRVFRLFPVYWVILAAGYVSWRAGWYEINPEFEASPTFDMVLNTTMVQEFLNSPNVIGSAWSLAYEMVFYLFMTMVFMAGLLYKGATKTTVSLLAASLSLGVLVGPVFILSTGEIWQKRFGVAVAVAVVLLTLVWNRLTDLYQKSIGVALAAVTSILVLNQGLDLWFSLLLFATLTCGWVYYLAYTNKVSVWVPLSLSVATSLLTAVHLRWWVQPYEHDLTGAFITWKPDALTMIAAHAVFAAAFVFLKSAAFPTVFKWLGSISYSVYLVHVIVLQVINPQSSNLATFAIWITVTLALSTVTYYTIEIPAQRYGKKLRGVWKSTRLGKAEVSSLAR